MAEVHVFGRVTNDLQLKMSHRQVPYVSFGLVEWIGRRDTGHRQYFEVWAWGTAALSLADAGIHKDGRRSLPVQRREPHESKAPALPSRRCLLWRSWTEIGNACRNKRIPAK